MTRYRHILLRSHIGLIATPVISRAHDRHQTSSMLSPKRSAFIEEAFSRSLPQVGNFISQQRHAARRAFFPGRYSQRSLQCPPASAQVQREALAHFKEEAISAGREHTRLPRSGFSTHHQPWPLQPLLLRARRCATYHRFLLSFTRTED